MSAPAVHYGGKACLPSVSCQGCLGRTSLGRPGCLKIGSAGARAGSASFPGAKAGSVATYGVGSVGTYHSAFRARAGSASTSALSLQERPTFGSAQIRSVSVSLSWKSGQWLLSDLDCSGGFGNLRAGGWTNPTKGRGGGHQWQQWTTRAVLPLAAASRKGQEWLPAGTRPLVIGRVTKKAAAIIKEIRTDLPRGERRVADMMDRWVRGFTPVRRDLLDVIKGLDRSGTRDLCCEVTRWALTQEWFEPNLRDYTKLLERLGKDRMISEMEETFREMETKGFPPDLISFSVMIGAYGKAGMLAQAEGMLAEMESIGITPDVKTFSSLMSAYGLSGAPEKAEGVFKEMESRGCIPNLNSYTVLMSAYSRARKPADVQRIFSEMLMQAKLLPDTRAYTALLDAYSKADDLENSKRVLESMRSAGVLVDDPALSILVEAFGRAGKCQEAVQLVLDLEANGQPPGVHTLTALIHMFGQHGYVDEAAEVFEEMLQSRITPIGKSYVRLFSAYARAGKLDLALKVRRNMTMAGWTPHANYYDEMISALLAGGLEDEAILLAEERDRLELPSRREVLQALEEARSRRSSVSAKTIEATLEGVVGVNGGGDGGVGNGDGGGKDVGAQSPSKIDGGVHDERKESDVEWPVPRPRLPQHNADRGSHDGE